MAYSITKAHTDGRRVRKVSRACDACKSRKTRCSGTRPCDHCLSRAAACTYNALYTRGKAPRPPSSSNPLELYEGVSVPETFTPNAAPPLETPSRNSPGAESTAADVHGQYVDSTSGLSFLHRARRRFARRSKPDGAEPANVQYLKQPITAAGDNPLMGDDDHATNFPHGAEAHDLVRYYFDICAPTYRLLHRPTLETWIQTLDEREQVGGFDPSKVAVVAAVFAIAMLHSQKSRLHSRAGDMLLGSDRLIRVAMAQTEMEEGLPTTLSLQARLLQVFYLLMTCRFNRAWYLFGICVQMIYAQGLHRSRSASGKRRRTQYLDEQIQKRTFWCARILDIYLGVVFGRPPHFYEENIDQDYPDRINDEDMTATGTEVDEENDCQLDAFLCNAKLASIVAETSREIYPIKQKSEMLRTAACRRLGEQLDKWYAELPGLFTSVKSSSLVTSFRRQSAALNLAYCHAIMHLYRPQMLGSSRSGGGSGWETPQIFQQESRIRCINAAEKVLRIVDAIAKDAPLFQALWWTHYVTFCALSVTYVWRLQRDRLANSQGAMNERFDEDIMRLAERCQEHLANATLTSSPSRRYSIILEELRNEAQLQVGRQEEQDPRTSNPAVDFAGQTLPTHAGMQLNGAYDPMITLQDPIFSDWMESWQESDWLGLDAFAFGAPQFSPSEQESGWPAAST